MSNDKMVDRIKKLMMLGLSDPDSPESKLAMEKAAQLMEEYNIQDVDITECRINPATSMTEIFVPVFSRTTDAWERVLGTSIAKCLDCRMITLTEGNRMPNRAFLGSTVDVELAVYFYKFIRMQIRKRAEDKFRLAKDQRIYGYGCAIKVKDRLDDMYGKRQEIIVQAGTAALMLVKTGVVSAFVDEKYPKLKTKKSKISGDNPDAFRQGMADGNKIKINRQVAGSSSNGTLSIGN